MTRQSTAQASLQESLLAVQRLLLERRPDDALAEAERQLSASPADAPQAAALREVIALLKAGQPTQAQDKLAAALFGRVRQENRRLNTMRLVGGVVLIALAIGLIYGVYTLVDSSSTDTFVGYTLMDYERAAERLTIEPQDEWRGVMGGGGRVMAAIPAGLQTANSLGVSGYGDAGGLTITRLDDDLDMDFYEEDVLFLYAGPLTDPPARSLDALAAELRRYNDVESLYDQGSGGLDWLYGTGQTLPFLDTEPEFQYIFQLDEIEVFGYPALRMVQGSAYDGERFLFAAYYIVIDGEWWNVVITLPNSEPDAWLAVLDQVVGGMQFFAAGATS